MDEWKTKSNIFRERLAYFFSPFDEMCNRLQVRSKITGYPLRIMPISETIVLWTGLQFILSTV